MRMQAPSMPPGPASVAEVLSWQKPMWHILLGDVFEGRSRLERLNRCLRDGLLATSAFTGMDAARYAVCSGIVELDSFLQLPPDTTAASFVQACDIGVLQRKFLCQLAETDSNSTCVLGDIEDRLTSGARDLLDQLEPHDGASVTARAHCYAAMHHLLLFDPLSFYPRDRTSACSVHPQGCLTCARAALQDSIDNGIEHGAVWHQQVAYQQRHANSMSVHFGSTVCSGHSALGCRSGLGHRSQRSHAQWISERKALATTSDEDVFFHENRPEYPVQAQMRDPLKETHEVLSIITDPLMFAKPVSRKRRMSCGINRQKWKYIGPQDVQAAFEKLFRRRVCADGTIFLTASDDRLVEVYKQIGAKRHVFFEDGLQPSDMFPFILTAHERKRRRSYLQQASLQGCEDVGCYDVSQNSRGGNRKDWKRVPCVIPHSVIVSEVRKGMMMGEELVQTLGVAVHDDASVLPAYSRSLRNFGHRDMITLAGGAFDVEVYASFVFFVLCNIAPVEATTPRLIICDFSEDEDSSGDTASVDQLAST